MDDVVFASRLRRRSVVDPDGVEIGRVDDVVVGSPGEGAPPVLGFVVTVPGRRIFLNAGRVATIEPGGLRLVGGAVDLRRYARRPGEILVLHDLQDRPVGRERVNDVGLRRAATTRPAWEVTVVDLVTPGPALLARRRPRRTIPWDEVRDLFGRPTDPHARLRDLHPADLADQVERLPAPDRARLAAALDDEQLADLLEQLPEPVQAQFLDQLRLDRAADVVEAMAPDDAADLLAVLSATRRSELLAAVEPEEAEPLRRLLTHAPDTAGGLMTPEPVVAAGRATVAEALAALGDPDVTPALTAQVFVVEPPTDTPTGLYLGTVTVRRLLREPPARRLAACIEDVPGPLRATLPQREVAAHLADYDLVAAPVTDADGRLLGAVTVDDVLQRLLEGGVR